jgi:hypothetical protein
MSTIDDRIHKHRLLIAIQESHPSDRIISNLHYDNMIGSNSKFGEVWEGRFPIMDNDEIPNPTVAIKKTPMKDIDNLIHRRKISPESFLTMKRSVWIEVMFLKKCNDLVRARICPSFILIFFEGVQKKAVFSNPMLTQYNESNSNAVIVAMELADGDLKQWCAVHRTDTEWASIMFQILFGIIAYQTHANVSHNDLHWGNILFKTVETPHAHSFWRYKYKRKTYLVPIVHTIVMITDFGFVSKLHQDNQMKDIRRIGHVSDWVREKYSLPNTFLDAFKKKVQKSESMSQLLKSVSGFLPNVQELDEYMIVDSFSLD